MRTLFLFIIVAGLSAQEVQYFHTYKGSDSHNSLTNWRVSEKDRGDKYIIETVDSLGRVVELRYIDHGKLADYSCYDTPLVKFVYAVDQIIQLNYKNDSTLSSGIECGSAAKIIYMLEKDLIVSARQFYNYDPYLDGTYNTEQAFRERLIIEKERNADGEKILAKFVWGFSESSAKYMGFLPTSKDYDPKDTYGAYSEEANNSEYAIHNATPLSKRSE